MQAKLKCVNASYNLNIPDALIAWDTCHKIYITCNEDEVEEAKSYGYEIHPVEDLREIWDKSCPLRFIELWNVDPVKIIIPQCVNGYIYNCNGELTIEVDEDKIKPDVQALMELGYLTPAN